MRYYIGIDVSKKQSQICVVDESGKIVLETKVPTDATMISFVLKDYKNSVQLVGIEAGCYSRHLAIGLRQHAYPVTVVDSRLMGKLLAVNINKTDRNDARVIANAMRTGTFREVCVRSDKAVEVLTMTGARDCIVEASTKLKNTVRGLFKAYGIELPAGGKLFYQRSCKFLVELPELAKAGIEALLQEWQNLQVILAQMNKTAARVADDDSDCKLLMTIPGVGPLTALSFKATIDDPSRFEKSRSIGAYVGCTPTQYASGETARQGRVSKQGATGLRRLLVGAALCHMLRSSKWSKQKAWGLKLMKKKGVKKASVALARKLSIIMHCMLITREPFRFSAEPPQAFARFSPKKKKNDETMAVENAV